MPIVLPHLLESLVCVWEEEARELEHPDVRLVRVTRRLDLIHHFDVRLDLLRQVRMRLAARTTPSATARRPSIMMNSFPLFILLHQRIGLILFRVGCRVNLLFRLRRLHVYHLLYLLVIWL